MTSKTGRPVNVAIVSSHGQKTLYPSAVANLLKAQGFNCSVLADGDGEMLKADIVLFMGSLASMRISAGLMDKANANRPQAIAWQSEPLPPPGLPHWAIKLGVATSAAWYSTRWIKPLIRIGFFPVDLAIGIFSKSKLNAHEARPGALRFCLDNLAWLFRGLRSRWIKAIAVSTGQKRLFLQSHGIEAVFIPVGQQESFGRDLNTKRDIDVLFIGNLKSPSRKKSFLQLKARLAAAGIDLYTPAGQIHGEARTQLVNRAKIMLHLHNFGWETPWMRWFLATANGAVIVSEPLFEPWPMTPGQDYVSVPLSEMAPAIIALLADETKRLGLLQACSKTINNHMSLEQSVEKLAAIMRELTLTGGRQI